MYPWGDTAPDCSRLNYDGGCVGDTSQVGAYPTGSGPYGALDMSGNVAEWVDDWYRGGTTTACHPSRNPAGPDTGSARVVRGGSLNRWAGGGYVRVAYRRRGKSDIPTRVVTAISGFDVQFRQDGRSIHPNQSREPPPHPTLLPLPQRTLPRPGPQSGPQPPRAAPAHEHPYALPLANGHGSTTVRQLGRLWSTARSRAPTFIVWLCAARGQRGDWANIGRDMEG